MRRQYAHRAPIGALCEGSSMRLYNACTDTNYTPEPRHDKTNKMDVRPSKTDQSLRCPHEESLGPYLPIKRTAKTLIKLGECPG